MARPRRPRDPIEAAPTSVTAVAGAVPGGPGGEPFPVTSFLDFLMQGGKDEGEVADALRLFFDNGGLRALVLGLDERRPLRSLDALADCDFNILVVPATARLAGTRAANLATAAALLAEDRRAFYVADAPAGRTAADVAKWARSFGGGPSTALYFPQVLVRGPQGDRAVPASGAVAGIYARVDTSWGVWKAPAGAQASLRGITGLAVDLTDDAHSSLTAAGVSTIRRLKSGPIRLWSARTRDENDPEWKYVNVRRFVLFLEESLDAGLQWTVFEPNDERLWAQVRAAVRSFLGRLHRQGALQGARPQEAFFVRCDRTTMTQSDLDSGRLVVLVGIAPVKPAEFVVFRIGLWARPDDD